MKIARNLHFADNLKLLLLNRIYETETKLLIRLSELGNCHKLITLHISCWYLFVTTFDIILLIYLARLCSFVSGCNYTITLMERSLESANSGSTLSYLIYLICIFMTLRTMSSLKCGVATFHVSLFLLFLFLISSLF